MKINIQKKSIDVNEIKVGDVILTTDDTFILICKDVDGADYRGVDLVNNQVTDYYTTIKTLVNHIQCDYGTIVERMSSDSIQISRNN